MGERPAASIRSYFCRVEDPRWDHTKQHQLIDIITIGICGVICGADSWVDLRGIWQVQGRVAEGISGVAQRNPFP